MCETPLTGKIIHNTKLRSLLLVVSWTGLNNNHGKLQHTRLSVGVDPLKRVIHNSPTRYPSGSHISASSMPPTGCPGSNHETVEVGLRECRPLPI